MFSACDLYKSQAPISNDKIGVEEKALGRWVNCQKNKEGLLIPICELEILDWGEKEDLVIFSTFDKTGKKEDDIIPFKVWISPINDEDYVNAKMINNQNNDYYFYRYRLDENGKLKMKYLKDSLTQKFESSLEFNDFIRNNKSDFHSYFNEDWIEYVKWDSLKWSIVNEHILGDISQLLIVDRSIRYEEFETKSIEELLPNAISLIKPKRDYLTFLDQYHLVAEETTWQKIKPTLLLLELKDGNYKRMLKGYNWILDLENNFLFKK